MFSSQPRFGFDGQLILRPLSLDWLQQSGVEVAVLRLDLVDHELSGNKWFKLVKHLEAAQRARAPGLISLGGAHSNHLHALAAAGRRFGLATVGLLRGQEQDTPTVTDLRAWGMQLHWLGYGGYRDRNLPTFWERWRAQYPGFYCIPEGGGGLLGAMGCAELVPRVRSALASAGWDNYDAIWLAAGTGTTLAGLVIGEAGQHRVFGALAGPPSHAVGAGVADLLAQAGVPDRGYELLDASRGGFGRFDKELALFILSTERDGGVPLDPIYTAKTMMALRLYIGRGYFPSGTRLIFVHTGGLQGRRAAQGQLRKLIDG
ncbi:1-aminocyclopropane-1-carboxylate deaminase [Stutzerimonas stutzeri]|uniref:1-aminocyclopropane-1-carboxylate deaminase n=1 Tax=Stutzerimonas stutzeri TaxID=316 RepID=A0A2S4ASS0_STUST|nr:pyridoxal-phosphate dependent enzyme [Stutzerimonas stutzeri]MCQ4264420.1 pyridoxal-phosphate dependent enzyme [Stutzerimonas stutzeri]POH84513.1 1-aminocyclopropane-1-carboxylate deaminase [Stutzerimonas stutzeri]